VNVVVLAIFAGVALTLTTLALAFGGGASGSRGQLSKRAQGLRRRQTATGASQGKGGQAPASLKRTQGGSVPLMDDLAKRFLPRQSALKDRLSRTGRDISLGTYIMISVGVTLAVFIVSWLVFGLPVLLASPLAVAAGVGLPHFAVGFLGARRQKKFLAIFPDSIDLIVRGLKSGLPVTESMAAVGREMADPVGTEFRLVCDSVRFGRQLEEVLWETAKRLETPEFNFFVICLSIQRETGGNLGETLANLSDILRRRRQMKLKIKAMSSEAKASAYILGSLPFVMFAMVYFLENGYAMELFNDVRGLMMVGAGMVSLLIGIGVMAKMVRFEI
jgi:tight adherence protein B